MTKQNRNVLITGGTGILGSAVTKAYLAQGDTVAVTYLFEEEVERFKQYNPELSEDVTFLFANVTVGSRSPEDCCGIHIPIRFVGCLGKYRRRVCRRNPDSGTRRGQMGFHDEPQSQIGLPLL